MNKKIYYFTNALDQSSFKDYLKMWKVSPNLSNQNFHNKLIRALALYNKVDVISVRAINSNFEKSKLPEAKFEEQNINWLYPKVTKCKVDKYLNLNKRINKLLSLDNSGGVILVDALNYSLLNAALKLNKRTGYKVIGVCTDNPYNISFTNESYTKKLMNYASKLDGYIALTKGINEVYNSNGKPYILIEGISEDIEINNKIVQGPYIYFGGSLMREYGIYNLIDAFKELDIKDTKLVICGHHVENSLFDIIKDNDSIVYLGPVNYLDNVSLVKNALLSVNPRPINPKIDDYSIPSKTLEYLSLRCLNVTVDNKLLKENYADEIIWAKSSSVEDLKDAIQKALSLDANKKQQMIESGYKKVMSRTSQSIVGQQIDQFLSKFFLN